MVHLKKALELDPDRPEAEWCLGNAYTSLVSMRQNLAVPPCTHPSN
jgi:hypothetical protein